MPADVAIFKKYLVNESLDVSDGHRRLNIPRDIKTQTLKIEEHYLNIPEDSNATSICVKSREKNGLKNYNYEQRMIVDGERIQKMRNLSAREYMQLIKNQDTNIVPL